MANHTHLNIDETPPTFSLFPSLPLELRHKTLRHALKTPRILALVARDHCLSILATPHPLLHTTYESGTEAMRVHSIYSTSAPDVRPIIINTSTDYLFLADEKTISLVLESTTNAQTPDNEALGTKLRHLALSLPVFESLLTAQPSPLVRDLFRTFPNLEEIVIVAGHPIEETLKRDVEFVTPRNGNVPRKGLLVTLCMEVFHPWRAFAHLLGVGMMEDAVGKWIAEKHAGEQEWKVPQFRIREVRCLSGWKK